MKTKHTINSLLLMLTIALLIPKVSCAQGGGEYHTLSVKVEGILRNYIVYEPQDHIIGEPWPVVFDFHGFGGSAYYHKFRSEMYFVADTAKFFIVYPEGMFIEDLIFNMVGTGWNIPYSYSGTFDDIIYVHAIIDSLISNTDFTIDTNRIHATGFSNGGEMANYIACKLSDRIASTAGVASQMTYAMMDSLCTPDRQISIIHMLGTLDSYFPAAGNSIYPPLPGTAEYWAGIDNCDSVPVVIELPDVDTTDNSTVTLLNYVNCYRGYKTKCYRINGGGHSWPGGGPMPGEVVNRDIHASVEIWNFFRRNPHPRVYEFCHPVVAEFNSQEEVDAFPHEFPNCVEIDGDLVIYGNDITNLDSLVQIVNIGGSLSVYGNDNLQSITGLSGITTIGNNLEIGMEISPWALGNPLLTDLSGLGNLSSIGGYLSVAYNDALETLYGLENIEAASIQDLHIHDNPLLAECDITSICAYLSAPGGIIDIHDNAAGCNDSAQVMDKCLGVFIEERDLFENLTISPNPASQKIFISANEKIIDVVTIYSLSGQLLYTIKPQSETIDISTLLPGMYIVEATVEGRKIRQKLLID